MQSLKHMGPLLTVILTIGGTTSLSSADEWAAPKKGEYYSASRKHVLRVAPSSTWPYQHGNCVATLLKLGENPPEKVWSRHLVNNLAPVDALVTDSGNYVVTLDEWGEAGTFPIVVYGKNGRLIRVHTLDTLRVHPMEIKVTVSNAWWREQAIPFFGPGEEFFFIRLRRGQMLMIQLSSGDLMDEQWYEEHRAWDGGADRWEALWAFGKKRARDLLRAREAARRERVQEAVQNMRGATEQREWEERASASADQEP